MRGTKKAVFFVFLFKPHPSLTDDLLIVSYDSEHGFTGQVQAYPEHVG